MVSGDWTTVNLLNIYDTSLAPPVYDAYFTSDAAGNNKITTANEGDVVYAVLEAANVPTPDWRVFGHTGGSTDSGTWQPFSEMTGLVTVNNGKTIVALTIPINNITTGDVSSFGRWSKNIRAMTPYLTIKNVYKTPSFRGLIWSRNMEGTQPVSSINPGEVIYLVVTQNMLLGRFEISFPLMDGVTTADFEYGVFNGSKVNSVMNYDPATGYGSSAYALKLKG